MSFNFMAAITIFSDFGAPPIIKSDILSTVSPFIYHEVMGPDAMILVFRMLSFKPTFSLSTFTFIKRLSKLETGKKQSFINLGSNYTCLF